VPGNSQRPFTCCSYARRNQDGISSVCCTDYWDGNVKSWALKAFGPVRYCMDCCLQSRDGNPQRRWSKDKVIQAIWELCDAFGAIPRQQFAYTPIPYDGGSEQRDRRMRALVDMPNVGIVKRVLGQKDWLGVLHSAGLVGETWRPSRGTWCQTPVGTGAANPSCGYQAHRYASDRQHPRSTCPESTGMRGLTQRSCIGHSRLICLFNLLKSEQTED
jgi:hypothetical protein